MKAKRKNQVTKRLGLKPMPRIPTIKAYEERRALLVKKLASGKLQGILKQRAHEYVYSIDFKLRKMRGQPSLRHRAANNNQQAARNQLALPGFLRGEQLVKFDEMIANRVEREVKRQLMQKSINDHLRVITPRVQAITEKMLRNARRKAG